MAETSGNGLTSCEALDRTLATLDLCLVTQGTVEPSKECQSMAHRIVT